KRLCTLQGHSDQVVSVTFSPDGTRIASGSNDRTVKVWDVASAEELRTLQGHRAGAQRVAFSPDGRANAPRMLKWARFFLIRTGWVVEKRPVFCSVISQTDNKC